MTQRSLLDLNVLIALADQRHEHHQTARNWFAGSVKNDWGICPLTEAGFLRVTTNPVFRPGAKTLVQAMAILQALKSLPGYGYWEIKESWVNLTVPFRARVTGHQQVTDAFLLGLAIKNNGVLVTFDRGLRYMAGTEFERNLLVLE